MIRCDTEEVDKNVWSIISDIILNVDEINDAKLIPC